MRVSWPRIRLGFAYRGKTLTEWYGAGDEQFERWWNLGSEPIVSLRAALKEFRPDLIHSHNLPDALTVAALELVEGRVPVVHDVHDLQSLRRTPYEDGFPEPQDPVTLERVAVEECSALVTVSDELLEQIRARHRLTAPTLVFPNYALGCSLPSRLPQAARHNGPPRLVYQGTLSTNGGHYDLREIFETLVAEGVTLDVYPSRDAPAYFELAARCPGLAVHRTLPAPRLMEALPHYDFGWAGFNSTRNAAHLDTCLPNKAFEYLGCGLPVLTLDHRALSRLLEDRGLGLSLTTFHELGGQLAAADLIGLRRRVAAARHDLTAEANIHQLTELYEAVVA